MHTKALNALDPKASTQSLLSQHSKYGFQKKIEFEYKDFTSRTLWPTVMTTFG